MKYELTKFFVLVLYICTMQFKKHIAFLLASFLLGSNSGLAVNVHYCGDTISGITSGFAWENNSNQPVPQEKECCAKKAESHKKCCSDKEINLDDDTQKIVIKSISFDLNSVFVFSEWKQTFLSNEVILLSHSQNFDYCCDANAPPLYQLYSQYILYA